MQGGEILIYCDGSFFGLSFLYCVSTGGDGCNIASGGALIGLGSDIGGSIRMPAFFNGIYGHKPSRGKDAVLTTLLLGFVGALS